MRRINKAIWFGAVLTLSWLLMQVVHELGHVAAAWATGATVTRVVLHPLAISRTDVEPNPQPLIVAWSGPIVGVAIPLMILGLATAARIPARFLLRFFAGFCLLANGLYLGVGSFGAIGDAGDILRHGSPLWTMWFFGFATAPMGLALWNGLGPAFGLGASVATIPARVTYCVTVVLILIVAVEMAFFPFR